MISVTNLSTYLFCPRKLFLEKVLKIVPPLKQVLVRGSLKHEVFDNLNKKEESIVLSVRSKTGYEDLFSKYQVAYYDTLISTIKSNKTQLKKFNLNIKDLTKQLWLLLLKEAKARSLNVYNFSDQHKLYGAELWQELSPKIVTELRISSDKLRVRGIVDKLEIHNNKEYVPFELKTGKPPASGVWPNQEIQLIAYIHLLQEFFKTEINQGFVHFLDTDEKRAVTNTQETSNNLLDLINKVHILCENKQAPPRCTNPNKCTNCSFNKDCFKLA